jgi:glucokinase
MIGTEYCAGIDLGGTNIKAVAIDKTGSVLYEKDISAETERGPRAVIEKMIYLLNGICKDPTMVDKKLRAVGIAAAGVVDMDKGICKFLPNLPGWKDIKLVDKLNESIETEIFLINDVRAMTLAEKTYGAGKGVKNLMCLAVGTGIGGGIILRICR